MFQVKTNIHAAEMPRLLPSSSTLKKLFFGLLAAKLLAFAVYAGLGFPAIYSVSDANLFDAIANGMVDKNLWGQFLKKLNDLGLYSRHGITTVIFLMNCFLLPWLLLKVIADEAGNITSVDWLALVCISAYPTLTFYSLDIYRETVMTALFLVLLWVIKYFVQRGWPVKWKPVHAIHVAGLLLVVAALSILRAYLVVALFLACVGAYFFDISKRTWLYMLAYVTALWLADQLGVFDAIKGVYRDPYLLAGSGYDIDFSEENFLFAFFKSATFSLYGISLQNNFSYIVLFIESVLAAWGTFYVIKNIKYSTKFSQLLVIFFLAYLAAWNVGCGALGTAARYRVFNYLALFIASWLIYKNKKENAFQK